MKNTHLAGALVACLAAAALFTRYPEREILAAVADAHVRPVGASGQSEGIAYTAARQEDRDP